MRFVAICVCALFASMVATAGASEYLESLGPGDLEYDLAAEMEAQGCTMTEDEMLAFLGAHGADTAMRQAIIVDLARLGDLRWDGKDSYTLVGRGACS